MKAKLKSKSKTRNVVYPTKPKGYVNAHGTSVGRVPLKPKSPFWRSSTTQRIQLYKKLSKKFTTKALAAKLGISTATIVRFLKKNKIKPY